MMVSLILIYKRDLFDIKMEIYYWAIKVITKIKCNEKHSLDKFLGLHFEN